MIFRTPWSSSLWISAVIQQLARFFTTAYADKILVSWWSGIYCLARCRCCITEVVKSHVTICKTWHLQYGQNCPLLQMPPDWGLATMQSSGVKEDKTELTFAFCANSDSSDWHPPLIIGHAQKPHCFEKNEGQSLGLDYWFNKKACMTSQIFQGQAFGLNSNLRCHLC